MTASNVIVFSLLPKSSAANKFIIGVLHHFKWIFHPNLLAYLDISQDQDGTIYVVSESATRPILQHIGSNSASIKNWTWQILSALHHLSTVGIDCALLSSETVRIDHENNIKLHNYLFDVATCHGFLVNSPTLQARYLPPEIMNSIMSAEDIEWRRSDVWSLGILVLELIGLEYDHSKISQILNSANIDPNLADFLKCCLCNFNDRWSIEQLLNHHYARPNIIPKIWKKRIFVPAKLEESFQTLEILSYLRNGDIRGKLNGPNSFPILDIPTVVLCSPENTECMISLKEPAEIIISLEIDDKIISAKQAGDCCIKINENEISHQRLRNKLFRCLLNNFPHSLQQIRCEAAQGIPLILRGKIWGALLNICGDPRLTYHSFDTQVDHKDDQQLNLDIPRCHQYHPLLSSPQGHAKLKRLLKAWIASENSNLVYWQGMDSLLSAFMIVNFEDEVYL